MRRKLLELLTLCMAAAVLTGCSDKTPSAVVPVKQTNVSALTWFEARHERVLERVRQGNVDLIMVGDSITHLWDEEGKDIWEQYYGHRNAVNLGFGADCTQHVLWRFEHGQIGGISPKLAVLMIGTNNSGGDDYTAEDIADGIKAICAEMRAKLPKTKILILAIFPRGDSEQRKVIDQGATFNDQWAKNNKASELASEIADDKMIFYLDINKAFLDENGVLTRDVMPDLLHLNEKGYEIWAEAMEPTIKKLMGEE